MEFLEIIGEEFAIAKHHFQMCHFWAAVLLRAAGTDSGSFVKPQRGEAFVFLPHDKPSVRKSAKLGWRDRMYFKLFPQASIEVIVSFKDSEHCFGALWEVILKS